MDKEDVVYIYIHTYAVEHSVQFSSVQLLSRVCLFVTPWTAACQASLSITNSRSLLKLMSIKLVVCHPTISSSVIPFSIAFNLSGSFQMSQLFTSGAQSTGVSASALRPSNEFQGWFPSGLTGLIFQFKELSRIFSSTTVWKYWFFGTQTSLWSNSHVCVWLLEKPLLCLCRALLAKWCLHSLIWCLGLS